MITYDYSQAPISPDERRDLEVIAGVRIEDITIEDYPNLLVFPDSFDSYDRDLARKEVCAISADGSKLFTNSIVGFIGRNKTHLSIHSRFAKGGVEDFFLHYMLQRVARINLFNLSHAIDEDAVFDFLIYMFPQYLKKALSQGVYKKYVQRKCNDAHMKGSIDLNRHIRYNEPFNGQVAYSTREHSYDNEMTQLIRHTIEFIKSYRNCSLLNGDLGTQEAVSQICAVTSSYLPAQRSSIINKNLRPMVHPYYSEYLPLQRLCLQILRYEELKYGQEDDEVYGVLIDAAWLWEEYLALILSEEYNHYLKGKRKSFYLFEGCQQIIPDFLSLDKKIVADAKYIPLDEADEYGEDKATSIYYKTITYMYRFCSNTGLLLYPHPHEAKEPKILKIKTEMECTHRGQIVKVGLGIPSNYQDFDAFCSSMKQCEQDFVSRCARSKW
ncbi:hypothetical protein [uncultured Porphyromonas sp.]|uniref:McrC family protein n=1 Tax=uncultured Porphyromonas sp. TaxID=159274 RepID=UPI0026217716|nr:hypothetical protein [uncultured Porphyromonas sp.]